MKLEEVLSKNSCKKRYQKKIAILGSCATRDAISLFEENEVDLVDYTARTSLASLSTRPFVVDDILKNISSSFQHRMVERDMRKDFWERLPTIKYDILVLDFIDDRFNLNLFDNQAAHTASSEYKKFFRDVKLPPRRSLGPTDPDRMALWEAGFRRLVKELHCLGTIDRLAVNCVFLDTRDCSEYVLAANSHLAGLYKKISSIAPETAFIRYPTGILRSDENHKWGNAPFHYEREVYEYFRDWVRSYSEVMK